MNEIRKGGYLIAKVHRLTGRVFHRKLKESSIQQINPAQGNILFALWQQDGISIQQLSAETSLKKNTLTAMLERLENQGYISRSQSESDKRKTIIMLKKSEEDLKSAYSEILSRMSGIFYEGFSEEEINRFEDYLQRIQNNLEQVEKGKANTGESGQNE